VPTGELKPNFPGRGHANRYRENDADVVANHAFNSCVGHIGIWLDELIMGQLTFFSNEVTRISFEFPAVSEFVTSKRGINTLQG
jgi:hypothetical protein